jgi:hypothetical protein
MYIHDHVTPPGPACFYRAAGYSTDESVGYLMKRVIMSITSAADRRLEPKGLTHAQWGRSSCSGAAAPPPSPSSRAS